MNDHLTIVIQAGGRSSRMGQDKGLVLLDGRPMVQHIVDQLRPITPHVFITTNRFSAYQFLDLPMYADEVPGAGALHGWGTALRPVETATVALIACDMPFISAELISWLFQAVIQKGRSAAVPIWESRLQPFHAVYQTAQLRTACEAALQADDRRVIPVVRSLDPLEIRPNEPALTSLFDGGRPFFNVNTPADLAIAQTMIAHRP